MVLDETPPVRVHAMLDAGVGRVDYDDFLPAGILSAAALVRLDLPYGLVAARGGVVRYDGTGNLNIQGGLAGSGFTGPWYGLRGEVSGSIAVGNHETVGSSGNGQVVARVHAASTLRGYWLGGGVGWSSYTAGAGGPVRHLDAGVWLRDGPWRLSVAVQPAQVDEIRYADVVGMVRWRRRRVELGLEAGARSSDVPTATDVASARRWATADAAYWLGPRLAVVAVTGRAPADPVAATGGGRYTSLAVRVMTSTGRVEEPPRVLLPRVARAQPDATSGLPPSPVVTPPEGEPVAEDLELEDLADGRVRLSLILPRARSAELMGDLTEWIPVPLRRVGEGRFTIVIAVPPGVHRLNIRADGGPWRVPPRLTAVDDGFGGQVGLLIVRR